MPGVVTVRSGVIIDREAFSPPVLELLLLAEDIGLLNGTADLLVTILDDNDNWPTFSPPALTVHLLENCPPGKQTPGPGPWPPAEAACWSTGLGTSQGRGRIHPAARNKGSRAAGESTGKGVRKTRRPSPPCSDPKCLSGK